MKYIANAFSPKMLKGKKNTVSFKKISKEKFDKEKQYSKSIIGHKEIAELIGVPFNRESVSLEHGDIVFCVVARPVRLEENHEIILNPSNFQYFQCKI